MRLSVNSQQRENVVRKALIARYVKSNKNKGVWV